MRCDALRTRPVKSFGAGGARAAFPDTPGACARRIAQNSQYYGHLTNSWRFDSAHVENERAAPTFGS
jgi:hypothetical protein